MACGRSCLSTSGQASAGTGRWRGEGGCEVVRGIFIEHRYRLERSMKRIRGAQTRTVEMQRVEREVKHACKVSSARGRNSRVCACLSKSFLQRLQNFFSSTKSLLLATIRLRGYALACILLHLPHTHRHTIASLHLSRSQGRRATEQPATCTASQVTLHFPTRLKLAGGSGPCLHHI